MGLLKTGLFALSALVASSQLTSAQQCSALLHGGVFNFSSSSSDVQQTDSFINWFCDEGFESRGAANSWSAALDVEIPVDIPVSIGFGGGEDKSSWQKSYQKYCSLEERFNDSRVHTRKYLKTVSKILVDGFNRCIQSPGLHVWLERTHEPRVFKFSAKFVVNGDKPPKINSFNTEPSGIKCNPNVAGTQLSGGVVFRALCTRPSDDGVSIVVNADKNPVGGGELDLKPILPPMPVPTCRARRVNSGAQTYYSHYPNDTKNATSIGVSVGGGGILKSERAFVSIDEKCDVSLSYSAGARGEQRFPENAAPSVQIQLRGAGGKILSDMMDTGEKVIVVNCHKPVLGNVDLTFVTASVAEQIVSFDISVVKTIIKATEGCG